MAQLIQNGDVLSGTSNDSANILYSESDGSSKNVQEKIGELDNEVEELNNNLKNNYFIKKMSVIPVTVTGTIAINSKQSVTIDITSYGFTSVPHAWVRDSNMCTMMITNVSKTSITVDIYNAWGGSIVANSSVLGQLEVIELAQYA